MLDKPREYFARSYFRKVPFLSESSLLNLWYNAVAKGTENQLLLSYYSEYLYWRSSYNSAKIGEVNISLM
jgi:hypothetical protein